MRKSLEHQMPRSRGKYQHRQLRISFVVVLVVALAFGTWVLMTQRSVDAKITAINEQDAQANLDFGVLITKLKSERITYEENQNLKVREAVYSATISGQTTPPNIGDLSCNYLKTHNDPSKPNVLVNKEHCLSPIDYAPETTTVYGITIASIAANDYKDMIDAAAKTGVDIDATSGYRSYAYQVQTYLYWYRRDGRTKADTYSAYPGYSEHQTGFAVDLASSGCALDCFVDTSAYTWMTENAYRYGYILRYPADGEAITGYSSEPWHWRYVGKATALEFKNSDVDTLEQFWAIRG